MLVDSHANLDGPAYSKDVDEVVARAHAAGVGVIVTISCKLWEFDQVLSIAERYEAMYCSVGTHPHEARHDPDVSADKLVKLAAHPKVIGIGETGLDLHYNHSPLADQMKSLTAHAAAARTTGLPLIIHTRDADDEMGDFLEAETANGAFPILMHCYTSGERLARRALDLGAYFAFSGILTFKKADDVRAIARDMVPDDRVMVETDCPYLAPVPYRGKRNEPAYVTHVAEHLAELKGWSVGEAAERTSYNFFDLFKKAARP